MKFKMNCCKRIILILVASVLTSFLTFSSASAQTSRLDDLRAQYTQFLSTMGFENFSEMMQQSLKNENFLDKNVSPKVLKFQIERLQMYNHVRELATEILITLHTTNLGPATRDDMIRFATSLLATRPTEPPTKLPDTIENLPAADRVNRATQYFIERTRDSIEVQSEVLMSNLISVLYGKEATDTLLEKINDGKLDADSNAEINKLKVLQQKVSKLVQFMYLDHEMGSFSVTALGKALVLGMTRYQIIADEKAMQKGNTKVNRENSLIEKLKISLRNAGLFYENYVGTTLLVRGDGGQLQKVEIRNGDFIHERSLGEQANEITAGARPGGVLNWIYGARLSMLGKLLGKFIHQPEDEITKPGFWQYVKGKMTEMKVFRSGVSHVGTAEVMFDPETGIKTTRSIDNYPDASEGGVRFTDILHQFARESEYIRLVVSRFDSRKFLKYARTYAKEVGYKSVVWMGDRAGKDGVVSKANALPWTADISKDEFDKLHDRPESQAEDYMVEVTHRVVQSLKMLHLQGMGFAYGFSNIMGRGYCTFTSYLGWMKGVNIEPQPVHDRWNHLVQFGAKIGIKDLSKYKMDNRILAPAGMMWQSSLVGERDIQVVDFPKLNDKDRASLGFAAADIALEPDLHRKLRTIRDFVKGAQVGASGPAEDSVLPGEIAAAIQAQRDKADLGRQQGASHPQQSYIGQVSATIQRLQRHADRTFESSARLSGDAAPAKKPSGTGSSRAHVGSCSNLFGN